MVLYSGRNAKGPIDLLVENQLRKLVWKGQSAKGKLLSSTVSDCLIEPQIGPDQERQWVRPLVEQLLQPHGDLSRAALLALPIQGHGPGVLGNRRYDGFALGPSSVLGRWIAAAAYGDLGQVHESRNSLSVAITESIPVIPPMSPRPHHQKLSRHD